MRTRREGRIPDRSQHPETLPRAAHKNLLFVPLQTQGFPHGPHDRRAELQHTRNVNLVDGSELGRPRGPEIYAMEEGKRGKSSGTTFRLLPTRWTPIGRSRETGTAIYTLPSPNRPIPINRLVPVPAPLRDIIAHDLVAPGAVAPALSRVLAADLQLFVRRALGEEFARESEHAGGERGGDAVVGEVEEAVVEAGVGEGVGASLAVSGGGAGGGGGEEGGDVD